MKNRIKPGGTRSYASRGTNAKPYKSESPKDGEVEQQQEVVKKAVAAAKTEKITVLKKDQVNKATVEDDDE